MCAENGCTRSLSCNDNFVVIIVFSVDVANTKVVGNLLILLFLKFHDFRLAGLGIIDFTSSLSGFAYVLYRSAMSCFLTVIAVESPLSDN